METRLTVSNNVKRKKWPLCIVAQERIYVKKNPQAKVPGIQERVLSLQPNTAMQFCSSITDPQQYWVPTSQLPIHSLAFLCFLYLKGHPENAAHGKLAHKNWSSPPSMPVCHMAHTKIWQRQSARVLYLELQQKLRNLIKNRRRLSEPDGIQG